MKNDKNSVLCSVLFMGKWSEIVEKIDGVVVHCCSVWTISFHLQSSQSEKMTILFGKERISDLIVNHHS